MKPHRNVRHPLVVLLLVLLTFGLYVLYWFYAVNQELMPLSVHRWPARQRLRDLFIAGVVAWFAGVPVWIAVSFGGLGGDAGGNPVPLPFLLVAVAAGLVAAVLLVFIEFRTAETVQLAQRSSGVAGMGAIPLFFLLLLIPVIGIPVVQAQVNRVWTSRMPR